VSEKIDLFKKYRAEYVTPKKPVLLEIGPVPYLGIDGKGAPGGDAFTSALEALYAMAYTVKMRRKSAGGPDYVVAKLETLYWTEDDQSMDRIPKEDWSWRMQIRVPEFVTAAELSEAVGVLRDRGKTERVRDVDLQTLAEGPCVQMLHVGPYENEPETIATMMAFVAAQGLEFHGCHHEIYLNDPRRIPPERLKTILRHPVRPK